MTEKLRKAELLFIAIGTVDDRFVAEAMEPAAVKKRPWQRKPFAYGLASAAAVLLVVLSVFGGSMLSRIYGYMALPEEGRSHLSLQHALDTARDGMTAIRSEDIDLFSGAQIIWQEKDTEGYYAVKVNDDDVSTLKSLTAASETAVDPEADHTVKLWISFGDGTVISPYLKENPGNVGYGELFDYEPEVYPEYFCSDMVIDLIASDA